LNAVQPAFDRSLRNLSAKKAKSESITACYQFDFCKTPPSGLYPNALIIFAWISVGSSMSLAGFAFLEVQ
jgi:hypothetical protein